MDHSLAECNTIRVDTQHHVLTRYVFNQATMKSVGERIRQAREFRKMSGEDLAIKVGYKTQSGISNLENRNGGVGGRKIVEIARALDLSLQWLLNGPDTADLRSVPRFDDDREQARSTEARETSVEYMTPRQTAHYLIDAMSPAGLDTVVEILRMTAAKYPRSEGTGSGVPVPPHKQRAA
jgi:transcriptional regulator with XRE-family HTH domain